MAQADANTVDRLQYGLLEEADASATLESVEPVARLRPITGALGQSADEPCSWSNRDADELRDALLEQTLATIQDGRSSIQVIEECWSWVMSDREGGFSFVTCAREAGCDPDALREVFEAHWRRHRQIDGPDKGQLSLAKSPWEWLKQAG